MLQPRARAEGQSILGYRDVPFDARHAGPAARDSAPVIGRLFIAASEGIAGTKAFERRLHVVRRSAEIAPGEELTVPSCSARTISYEGPLTASLLDPCFPDLLDPRFESALALVHSGFSTNTSPS